MDRNTVNYKALAFIADQTASTFHYEVKGVRALWDPSLSIPGTNRRGGWRCPLGTRFGGQITDRYGRSCGWGVARRLANGIADIGERLESIDDRKRNARVAKRNARVARQLARDVKPGLLERGARGIADALDGGGGKPVRKPMFDRPRIGGRRPRPRSIEAVTPNIGRGAQNRGGQNVPNGVALTGGANTGGFGNGMRRFDPFDFEGQNGNSRRRGKFPQALPKLNASEIQKRVDEVQYRLEKTQALELIRNQISKKHPGKKLNDLTPQELEELADWAKTRGAELERVKRIVGAKPIVVDKANRQGHAMRRFASEIMDVRDAKNEIEARGLARRAPEPPKKPSTIKPINPRRRGNLRDSEARRMEREIVKPGAPRTGEGAQPQAQPPTPNLTPRERRRDVSNQGAARSIRRVPTANDVPEAPPAKPILPARRSRPPEPPVKVPATAKSFDLAKEFENASEAEKKQVQEALAKINSKKRDAQDNMKLWGNSNIEQLERHVESQKQEMQRMDNQLNVMLDGWNRNKDNPQMREGAMVALIRAHEYRETHKNNLEAMEGRVNELRGGKPAPVQPREPKQPPQPPKTPERPSVIDVKPASVKSDYRQEKIGALGEDGLPDIVAVPKGNKGMDTQEQANEFVRRRGELADVPDEFLGEALRQNSTGNNPRFQQKRLDAHGVNANQEGNMVKYEDARNGKTYYLKYALAPQTANEDLHEVMGNNIAGRMGMPVGQIRFDGVARDGQHRAILFEDVRNYMDGEVVSPGDGKRIVNGDKVRATLLDFAIVNVDRHGNNFFGVNQNGVIRFAAIDPSLGFDAEWHGKVFKNIEPNESGLRRWLNHDRGGGRNEMLSNLRKDFNEGRMHRDEVVAVVAEIQKSMREAEAKNAYRSFAKKAQKAASVGGRVENRYGDADNYIVNKPDERMKFIADIDPSRLADIILGR